MELGVWSWEFGVGSLELKVGSIDQLFKSKKANDLTSFALALEVKKGRFNSSPALCLPSFAKGLSSDLP
ncbi:MAG: hypothetical protein A2W91_15400 [Bacteroidetes bacterium GWF2_38_335]|nr:MAG: hypothetical protein A2W91_15400 [Bacteroidetes bacterium GWF2_38_335]OFY81482.1 MAG: hypothetical protein A2281_11260 [Bacteroidetes bacterium RIFOXYA12_FULL_38_20]HBS87648.1 hypothetical protein [Bacteroidales bacterium]